MTAVEELAAALDGSGPADGLSGDVRLFVETRRLLQAIAKSDGIRSAESAVLDHGSDSFRYAFTSRGMFAGWASTFDNIRVDDDGRVVDCAVDGVRIGRLVRSFSSSEQADIAMVGILDVPWGGRVMGVLVDGGPIDWSALSAERIKPISMVSPDIEIETAFGPIRNLSAIPYRSARSDLQIYTYEMHTNSVVFPNDWETIRTGTGVELGAQRPAGFGAEDLLSELLVPLPHPNGLVVEFPPTGQSFSGMVSLDLTARTDPALRPHVVQAIPIWLEQEVAEGYFDFGVPDVRITSVDDDRIELLFEPDVASVLAVHHLARRLYALGGRFGQIVMTLHSEG